MVCPIQNPNPFKYFSLSLGQGRTDCGSLPKTLMDLADINIPPFRGVLFVRYPNDGFIFQNGSNLFNTFTNDPLGSNIYLSSNRRLMGGHPALVFSLSLNVSKVSFPKVRGLNRSRTVNINKGLSLNGAYGFASI